MANFYWNLPSSGDWSVATNWSPNTTPGASDDAFLGVTGIAIVQYYTVSVTTSISVHSLTVSDAGAVVSIASPVTVTLAANYLNAGDLELQYGGQVTVSGNFSNVSTDQGTATVNVDTATNFGSNPSGGSTLSTTRTLNNTGRFNIGNSALTAQALVSVGALQNSGVINLTGNSGAGNSKRAVLDVLSAAPSLWTGTVSLSGQSLLEFSGGSIGGIAQGAEIYLASPNSYVADAGDLTHDSALTGLTNNAGDLELQDAAAPLTLSSSFTNTGSLNIDTNTDYGLDPNGGSRLNVTGTLTNSGGILIGNANLGASSVLTAAALVNTGSIRLVGDAAKGNKAILDILGAAPTTLTGFYDLGGRDSHGGASLLEFGSGQITSIAAGAELYLANPTSFVADASDLNHDSALTDLSSNAGDLEFQDAAAPLTLAGGLTNTGTLYVDSNTDYGGDLNGGSRLTITGTLTNTGTAGTNNGTIYIGNSNLGASSLVTAGSLVNTGSISLVGNVAKGNQATLDILGAAPTTLTGFYDLGGRDSHGGDALLEFGSGKITSIAAGAELYIANPTSFVADAGDLTHDSALTSLASNAGDFELQDAAAPLTLAGGLTNTGTLNVDSNTDYGLDPNGGSRLTITGTLTNTGLVNTNNGTIYIGNNILGAATVVTAAAVANTGFIIIGGNAAKGSLATLDITGAAPTTLTGYFDLGGRDSHGGDSLLEFGSGTITSIAAGAELYLANPTSFVADANDLTHNSALTGLASNSGDLELQDAAAPLTLSGNFVNTGTLFLDTNTDYGLDTNGGSRLTIAGTLTNTGPVGNSTGRIGIGNTNLGAKTIVTAAALVSTGSITITGNVSKGNQAILDITGLAPTTLTGSYNLGGGDSHAGDSLLEFGSGQITAISAGASLYLANPTSFVADANDLTHNSALKGLASNAGDLELQDAAAPLILSGGFTNSGTLYVDTSTDYGLDSNGGSSVTVNGALTNSGTLGIGNSILGSPSVVTATSLVNTGTINLTGDNAKGNQAVLDITGAAPTTLSGTINLGGQSSNAAGSGGDALLEFGSGKIASIGQGASLIISNPNSFVADAGAITSNSALTGLTSNAGFLGLQFEVAVALSGAFSNSGTLYVDQSNVFGYDPQGGSSFTIAGMLTNSGAITLGNNLLSAATSLSATALDNAANATIAATGGPTFAAALDISGAVSNEGVLTVNNGADAQFASLTNTGNLGVYGSVGSPGTLNIVGSASNSGVLTVGPYANMGVTGAFNDSATLNVGGALDIAGGMELTATGALVMQGGQILTPDAASVIVDTGATLSGYGAVLPAIVNAGTVTASGGLLDLAGPVTGSGVLAVAPGGELQLGGATAQTVAFGGVGTLKLDKPVSFTGSITGLVQGDAVDLAGVQATSAVVSGSILTVTAGSETYTYTVSGSGLATNTFAIEDDQQGGTDLVLGPPGPVISGPTTQTAFLGWPTLVGPITISDPNAGNGLLTVTITAGAGSLAGTAANSGALAGSGGNKLTLTGDLADINAMLAGVTYSGSSAGATDNLSVTVADASHATAAQTISVTTDVVPFTQAVLNFLDDQFEISGVPTALSGLSVSDPYAEATGQQLTLSAGLPDSPQTYTASGGPGGTVTGQGTNNLSITGTVPQINSYIADSINIDLAKAYAESLVQAQEAYEAYEKSTGSDIKEAFDILKEAVTITGEVLEGGSLSEALGVYAAEQVVEQTLDAAEQTIATVSAANYYFAANVLNAVAAGSVSADPGEGGGPAAHILTADGLLYQFDAAGEFVFAKSNNPGDSFQVQVRLQPNGTSAFASEITAVAATLGSDRISFAVGRGATVWVNGTAAALTPASPIALSGGKLSRSGVDTYVVTWNSGEIMTVVDDGSYLDVSVNGQPGATAGLIGPGTGQANDFTLPDGTVLPQPLASANLSAFANAWRVSAASSLFDYGSGQTTADFTNLNFPTVSVSLGALPASVLAQASQAIAATGVTDAGVFTAMEYDYIASGGDPTVLASDASLFQGLSTTPAAQQSGSVTAAIGVFAPVSARRAAQSGATTVTFEVYLTAPQSTATTINYAVESTDPSDFTAAALGGALPTGSITIAAGQTTGVISVDVPQGALGASPSKNLALRISSPGGLSIFSPTSRETVAQATATAPVSSAAAAPQLEYLGQVGTFSQSGNNYTLDLGQIQFGQVLPALQFSVANSASNPGDALSGSFDWTKVAGFEVNVEGDTSSGASLASSIAAGSSYQALTVSTIQNKFGAQNEVITFTPVDTNASGYSSALAPITLTIADTLEVPGMIYSQAWGDVHIITYNGLHYDFQAAGEFTLAKSNIAGDSFDIQLRLQPFTTSSSVTLITQVAASLGSDRVTFGLAGIGRAATVLVDGATTALSAAHPTLNLTGGSITEVSPTLFKVAWNTGESMNVTSNGYYFNVSDAVPYASFGEIGGLQGENEGTQNDFQLPDGTVLSQPLSTSELYGEYANAWRVTPTSSLFDYGPGQSTSTFTDLNFPSDPITLADLPTSVVAQAAALGAAAGITDPVTAEKAELDYIATGDPSFIAAAANINQQVVGTVAPTITPGATPIAAIGVQANKTKVTEASTGSTAVSFTAYLTAAATADTTVDYAVISPDAGDLSAAAFGGAFPSGAVVISKGQTSAQFTINLPQGALGASPDSTLQVQVSSPGDAAPVFAPTAQTEIVNNQKEPGASAVAELAYLGNIGAFSYDAASHTYTLNLGGTTQGASVNAAEFAVVNAASAPSDSLTGTFTAPVGTGFVVTGASLPSPLAAGQTYQGLYASVNTAELGANGMTLTFNPVDVNDSGYSAALTPLTLKIVDSVVTAAQPRVNTPTTLIFPNVHVGATENQHVSVTNTAPTGAANLDVSLTAGGAATASGSISKLTPGATDASDLLVGLDTSVAGARNGSVTEKFVSDAGPGDASPIAQGSPYIDVFGSVYRLAEASVAPNALTVHVGASGSQALQITNLDPSDGYSENLIATVVGATGGVTASGTTGEIAAQKSGSIAVHFSTTTPGPVGTLTLDLKSDGAGIDGLGVTDLGEVTVPVSVTSTNVPAVAQFEDLSGGGIFTQNGAAYRLDLGTIAAPTTVSLGVLNSAAAPADALSGSFDVSGTDEFVLSGFGAFSGIAAGHADTAPQVTLNTGFAGTFTETITLHPTDGGASLPAETLTITGKVATPTAPPVITAPSSAQIQSGVASAIAGVSIADSNAGVSITAVLSDQSGLLSATTSPAGGGGAILGVGTTSLTITGTQAQVNADLTSLSETSSNSDMLIVRASDSDGGIASPALTTLHASTSLPTVTIDAVDGDNAINYAQAHAAAGVALSGEVSGLAPGATFSVLVADGTFSKSYTATVSAAGAGWTATLPQSDAIALPNGTATITASVAPNVQASAKVTVAEALPTVTISPVDGNNIVNYAQAHAAAGVPLSGTVTGLAPGATFSVSLADGTFAKSYTASVNSAGTGWTATLPEADAITLHDGTATVSAQVTDVYGNVSAKATDSVTVAEALPTVTISPVDGNNIVNYAQAHAAAGVPLSGTVTGLAAGATFSVSLADGSFSKSYTASVNSAGTGWTATLPEAVAITLHDGTATVSAQVTDVYGNVSAKATDSVTVAETLPTVTISPVDGNNVVNYAQAHAAAGVPLSGTVTGLAPGATFSVSLADGTFAKSYTASVNSAGTGWTATLPEADAITLHDGTATVSAQVTDLYGNVSAKATDSVTVAETLPTVTISPVDGNNVVNYAQAHAAAGVPLSGTVTGLAAGATFSVSLADGTFAKSYTASVNSAGTGWTATLPEADAITLHDGTATVSAQVTDLYGNVSAKATDSVTVAETLPTVTISPVDGNNVVNYAQAHAAAGVPLSGTVTGLAPGATFSVSLADGTFAKSYTASVNSAGTGWTATPPEADAITLHDGTATVSAQVADLYGNVSAKATDSVTVAETLPTVTISPVDGNNVVNYAQAHAAAGVPLSGTVTGLAPGATFSVSLADGTFANSYTASVNSAGSGWTATLPEADAITLHDGTATVSAQVTDLHGNVSAKATDSVTVAEASLSTVTISPVDGNNVINYAQAHAAAGVPLSGTVTGLAAGATFSVSLVDGTISKIYTAKVNAAGTGWTATLPKADAVSLHDGTATITAIVSSTVQSSEKVTVAETPPTVTIAKVDGNNVINYAQAHAAAGVCLSGNVTGLAAGATFSVYIADGAFAKSYTAKVNAAGTGWTAVLPEADAIKLPNGKATVTAQVTDAWGNMSAKVSDTVTIADRLPTVTINEINGDDVIDNATPACGDNSRAQNSRDKDDDRDDKGQRSSAVALSGAVTGLAPHSVFAVIVADAGFNKSYVATVNSAGTAWTATIPQSDVAQLPNGMATVTTKVVDSFGNWSLPAVQRVVVKDTSPFVQSVAAQPAHSSFRAGQTIAISLNMNEAVIVTGSPTLQLNDCGSATFDKAHSTATQLTFDYTVASGQNTSDLRVTNVALGRNGSIKDSFGDQADLSGAPADLGLVVDTQPPCVKKAATSLHGDARTGQTVPITLTISEGVVVTGSPTLLLSDGGVAKYDAVHSTSTALVFDYNVAAGQVSQDLRIAGVVLPSQASVFDRAGNIMDFSGACSDLALSINAGPHNSGGSGLTALTIPVGGYDELFGASSAMVTFASSTGELKLDDPHHYSGDIFGFGASDKIDLTLFQPRPDTFLHYQANHAGTGGILSIGEGAWSELQLAFTGHYTSSNFALTTDGHAGALLTAK